ncbi:MAG: hypothetical protein M1826_001251 [Phylliscum demangeonii]|nr:MAG: hypothetical protein M1826_001251 [Phylliscum demangeonii]
MSTISVRIPLLTSSNYDTWKTKMKMLLIREGLWHVVRPEGGSDDKPTKAQGEFEDEAERATATIFLSLDDSTERHIRDLETPRGDLATPSRPLRFLWLFGAVPTLAPAIHHIFLFVEVNPCPGWTQICTSTDDPQPVHPPTTATTSAGTTFTATEVLVAERRTRQQGESKTLRAPWSMMDEVAPALLGHGPLLSQAELGDRMVRAFGHLYGADQFYPGQEPLPRTNQCRFCGDARLGLEVPRCYTVLHHPAQGRRLRSAR